MSHELDSTERQRVDVVSSSKTSSMKSGLPDPLIGMELADRYRIDELIGSGGWGNVYKGEHLTLGTDVAVKVIHRHLSTDEGSLKRLELEAKHLSKLDSPSIVRIIDYGLYPVAFMVMELFEGMPLNSWLKEKGPLKNDQALELFQQMCDGLTAAQALSIVHRDLKPSNIMLRFEGNELHAKILDFGIARLYDDATQERLTSTGEVLGSPPYMSPEQWKGQADHRSDIYALGCIMYEVVSGRPAFSAQYGTDYMHKHLFEVPLSFKEITGLPNAPMELEKIIFKCLQKSPEDRYQSADQIRADIALVRAGRKVKLPFRLKKIKSAAGIAGILALASLLLGGIAWLGRVPLITTCCEVLNTQADAAFSSGKPDEALEKYRRVISLAAFLPPQDRRKLHAMRMLSTMLKEQQMFLEAMQLDRQVMSLIAPVPTVPGLEPLLGRALFGRVGNEKSAQLASQGLQLARSNAGEHSMAYSASAQVLGNILSSMGKIQEAITYHKESLRIAEELLEPDDLMLAQKMFDLGQVLQYDHQNTEAQKLFLQARTIRGKNANGPLPWNVSGPQGQRAPAVRSGYGRAAGPGYGPGVGPGAGVGPGMGAGVGPGMGPGVGPGIGQGSRPSDDSNANSKTKKDKTK